MRTNTQLAQLRGQLDLIDDDILALVEQRLTICRRIADSKAGTSGLKLCPDRQRAVVERLRARANDVAAPAVPHIWREIMAHGVAVQGPTMLLLPDVADRDLLLRLARDAYGSAPAVAVVKDGASALARARCEDAIAVLPADHGNAVPDGLAAFDALRDESGALIGWLVGRVDQVSPSTACAPRWAPSSWRSRPTLQQPDYPNRRELQRVERRLSARAPLVELNDIDALRRQLGEVANGNAILLQGGDCVETAREHSEPNIRQTAELLHSMGRDLAQASGVPVVHVGRIAGQTAKPRSNAVELVNGAAIAVYRGDAVNGEGPDAAARIADPQRLLNMHDRARTTMSILWDRAPCETAPIYVSHEALLLGAEQAMTHYDERSGRWWAGSAHMLWIGERTRQLEGGHVEYARGISNPIGVKVGPTMTADDLMQLIGRLDPEQDAGRLTLIPRLGKGEIADRLPPLMRAVKASGRTVLWCVDPMHGNTRVINGRKTRELSDIISETLAFHDIAASEGVWPGGLHLELTGANVLECGGGGRRWLRLGARPPYLSGCDPRLNREQALELGQTVAAWHSPLERRKAG
nr:3-deoxy-7-phosphoheptulonate synthase [uncultured Sphingomonas sp.]